MPIGERVRGRDGARLVDAWRGQPAAHLRHDGRRLPQPVPAARAEHRPRPQLDRLHDRVADQLRARRAAGDARRAARRSPRSRPEAQAAYNARARRRSCDGTVWSTAAARAGTSTRPAATRRCGPTGRGASACARGASSPASTRSRRRAPSARRWRHERARAHHRRARAGSAPRRAAALRARGARVVGLDLAPTPATTCSPATSATRRRSTRAVAEAIERLGGLDVLINNAGHRHPAERRRARPTTDALAVIDVNLLGPWRVTAAALPGAARRRAAASSTSPPGSRTSPSRSRPRTA